MATGLQSLFLRLPTEIIATIFEHCIPLWPSSGHQDRPWDPTWPSPNEAPLLLAQICRRWREICLDTPSLWASVVYGDTGSIDLLEVWLSRARKHRLRIRLESDHEARAGDLLRTIEPHSSRWQEVHFQLPTSAHERLNTFAFPCLEWLTLIGPGGWMEPTVFQDAPALRYAEIIYLPHLTIAHPWVQLTSLVFRATVVTPDEYIALLGCCPNLLTLCCGSTVGLTLDTPQPFRLSSLRSLKLTDDRMLHCLTVPRLERLHLFRVTYYINTTTNALQSLVARSCCDVQFLSFSFGLSCGSVRRSRRFFRVVNASLLHLRLYSESAAEFEKQIEVLRGDDVLPRLRRLEMRASAVPTDYTALLGLLRWRRRESNCTLESFELLLGSIIVRDKFDSTDPLHFASLPAPCRVARAPSAAVMDHFGALAEAGLEVAIRRRAKDAVLTVMGTARSELDSTFKQ
ncbi:hypothetical protein DFH06DRAFT_1210818 [Mycena polygramma]|nr:hypothetical protein DFH06DRAFT_1210818 [Mycena polygramma]